MPADDVRMAEHTARLLEMVSWDWQPLAPLVEKAAAVIPPGKALRRYQRNRAQHEKSRSGEGPVKAPLSETEQIASGRKSLMTDALGTLRKQLVETEDRPDGRWVRRRSQVPPSERCPHCGRPGAEDESRTSAGARSEGLEGLEDRAADDQGDFDFPPRPGVVLPFERPVDYEAEDLRSAVEDADEQRPGPTLEDVLAAVSELVTIVESQGKRIDTVMNVAQSAKNAARQADLRVRYGGGRTPTPRERKRTRGGQQ